MQNYKPKQEILTTSLSTKLCLKFELYFLLHLHLSLEWKHLINELYNWQVKTMKLIRCIHHSISISASNQNPWGSVSWVLLTKKMKYKSWNNNGLLKRFSPKERAP